MSLPFLVISVVLAVGILIFSCWPLFFRKSAQNKLLKEDQDSLRTEIQRLVSEYMREEQAFLSGKLSAFQWDKRKQMLTENATDLMSLLKGRS